MKIQHLLNNLNEAGPRTAAQQATMKAAATGIPQANNPFNLKVMSGGKGTGPTTSAATTNPTVKYNVPTSTVPQTKSNLPQPTTAPKTAPAQVRQPASQTTGDPTLNNPLPAKAPKDPNAPGIGTKIGRGIGQLSKAAGAIAGVPAGIARAVKKGYEAGASTIGGPGSLSTSGSFQSRSAGAAEVDSLKSMLQAMDARLKKAGI